ncbi:MAG: hypothetical protein FWG50_04370 [Kiritimatiellaeota bacterium]|nr:hypothetical protein [Kiritimatiellota bacterium]
MKTMPKYVLLPLCCFIVDIVMMCITFHVVSSADRGAVIDEGVPVPEIQNVIQSNADFFATYKIVGFAAKWGCLSFVVLEDTISSGLPMIAEFDCERKITMLPLSEHIDGKGLACQEFLGLLEMARNELEHGQEPQLGLLWFIFNDDGDVGFYFGWSNHSLSGEGISIWFHKVDGVWQKKGTGHWIS